MSHEVEAVQPGMHTSLGEGPSMINLKQETLRELSTMLGQTVFPKTGIARRKKMEYQPVEVTRINTPSLSTGPRVKPITPVLVLRELFELLEDYGPSWYTQEHHDRAVAALAQIS